jgi:cytidylate kinase
MTKVLPALALTIAISREKGANGTQVAEKLGERLGWPVYDRELLRRVAEDMGLRTSLLEGVDEKRTNWVMSLLDPFTVRNPVSEGTYLHHLMRLLVALATRGECIIVGRGAAQFLPAQGTLRVRLVAPLDDRVRVIQDRDGISREEAARRVKAADEDRSRFVREHFGKDPTAAAEYDLVLNTSRFSPEECAELIEQALRRCQARTGAAPTGGPR